MQTEFTIEPEDVVVVRHEPTFVIKEFDTVAQSSVAAIEHLSARAGQLVQGHLSKTSNRSQFATTSLVEALVEISSSVEVDKSKLKMGEGTDTQRPVDPAHV